MGLFVQVKPSVYMQGSSPQRLCAWISNTDIEIKYALIRFAPLTSLLESANLCPSASYSI